MALAKQQSTVDEVVGELDKAGFDVTVNPNCIRNENGSRVDYTRIIVDIIDSNRDEAKDIQDEVREVVSASVRFKRSCPNEVATSYYVFIDITGDSE